MKTRILALIALVVMLFSFSATNNDSKKKNVALKPNTTNSQLNKGLAMEDKDQFN